MIVNEKEKSYISLDTKVNVKDPLFQDLISRDDLNTSIKPQYFPYFFVQQYLKIIENYDKVYFFENAAENLVTAKEFGWVTIFIRDGNKLDKIFEKYVDYQFENIEEALTKVLEFITKSKKNVIPYPLL